HRVAEAVLPAREGYVAVVDGIDRRAAGRGDVDPVVVPAAPGAPAEAVRELAGDVERPAEHAGPHAGDFLAAPNDDLDARLAEDLVAQRFDGHDLAVDPLDPLDDGPAALAPGLLDVLLPGVQIGRASCRRRGQGWVVAGV